MICSLRVAFAIGKLEITVAWTANSRTGRSTSTYATALSYLSTELAAASTHRFDCMLGQLLFLMDGVDVGVILNRCRVRSTRTELIASTEV